MQNTCRELSIFFHGFGEINALFLGSKGGADLLGGLRCGGWEEEFFFQSYSIWLHEVISFVCLN